MIDQNMKHASQDPIRTTLQVWQPEIEAQPDLADSVLRDIRGQRRSPLSPRVWLPLGAAAALLLFFGGALMGIQLGHQQAQRDADDQLAWSLAINPASRAIFPAEALASGRFHPFERLDWMRREFNLTAAQFQELASLQQDFAPEFETLYQELIQVQSNYDQFDAHRRSGNMIDFIALHDLLQGRDELRQTAQATSAEFIRKLHAVLRPAQQNAFHLFLAKYSPELAPFAPAPRDA